MAQDLCCQKYINLGAKGSGKTSLIYLIRYGTPFQKDKHGEINTADPTTMGIVIGHKFAPKDGKWLRVAKDLPGDLALRYQWSEAIGEVKPHGIIFMIDGRNEAEIEQAYELLNSSYSAGTRELVAFHVFVNFADRWAESVLIRRQKLREFESKVNATLEENPGWFHLRTEVHATQLSPHDRLWHDAERALKKFGIDLET